MILNTSFRLKFTSGVKRAAPLTGTSLFNCSTFKKSISTRPKAMCSVYQRPLREKIGEKKTDIGAQFPKKNKYSNGSTPLQSTIDTSPPPPPFPTPPPSATFSQ